MFGYCPSEYGNLLLSAAPTSDLRRSCSLPATICEPPSPPCVPANELASLSVPKAVYGCGTTATSLTYVGSDCGGGLIRWNSFTLATASGPACLQRPKGSNNPLFDDQWFGGCGVPPYYFSTLGYRICSGGGTPSPSPAPSPTPRPRAEQ